MIELEPGLCWCGHYWSVHKVNGCIGWLRSERYPWWARMLRDKLRLVPLLRCKCSWEYHQLPAPAVTEEER